MDWLYYLILIAVLLSGLLLNVVTLPGNWLMLLAMLVYGWGTGWVHVSWPSLVVLLVLAVIGEVVEFFAAGAAASKMGGSKWGAVAAIVGGLIGGILLTSLAPIIGTLIGVLVGTFLGAAVGEMIAGKEMEESMFIGVHATKGRLYGTLLKLGFGILMFIIALFVALPF